MNNKDDGDNFKRDENLSSKIKNERIEQEKG